MMQSARMLCANHGDNIKTVPWSAVVVLQCVLSCKVLLHEKVARYALLQTAESCQGKLVPWACE